MEKDKNAVLIFNNFELGNSLLEWDGTEHDMRVWLVECMETNNYVPTVESLCKIAVIMDYYTELRLNLCVDENSSIYLGKYLVDFEKLLRQGVMCPVLDSTVPVEINWYISVCLLILKSNKNEHTVDSLLNETMLSYKEFISLLTSDKWLQNKIYDNTINITPFTYDNE